MAWKRRLNGTREQASNTEALDEKNREPSWLRTNQLGEDKTRIEISGQAGCLCERWTHDSVIVNNVDAYDDVKTEDHMPSDTKGIVEEYSRGERSNQLGRKPVGKQAQSPTNVQEQEKTEHEQLVIRADENRRREL
ncbi:putative WRKY transcription factor 20 [Dorcoceras hygrometricum]|uniref:Putative WRKY transcription factor 20 n=1 Tax=Dorcoceras hygrometricum TaxID=472368 RepID=A0A2Z7BZU8_9LAMI|nr:putative WRKY transcription factor 20 [Dorcoceras hygrometricum]